ncbi:hypothetical protein Hanom_Chr08g00705931 [Helianthus anomalus]
MYLPGSRTINECRLSEICNHEFSAQLFFKIPAVITIARGKPLHFLVITFACLFNR